ncbi:MAG: hypothetical protein FWG66_00090 [Spirochaetes bacterium]|nr:hypothetical protein [Spirochaetota bacterium]
MAGKRFWLIVAVAAALAFLSSCRTIRVAGVQIGVSHGGAGFELTGNP